MQFLFCLLFLLPGDSCREKYFSEVFDPSKAGRYLLVVKAEKQDKKNLFIVLRRFELESDTLVDDRIKSKIKNGTFTLLLNYSSKYFFEFNHQEEVNMAKIKGEKYFIETYFDEWGLLKEDVPFEYIGHIIEVLFNWNILMTDTEWGGGIYIDKKQICRQK